MLGYIKELVSKRKVDFAGLEAGLTQEIILADRLDLLDWREATLVVKVYSHSLASGAGTLRIGVHGQSISADDPTLDFIDRSVFTFVALNSGTPSPALLTTSNVVHPMVRLIAEGTRTGAGALDATVSVEVSVKDA